MSRVRPYYCNKKILEMAVIASAISMAFAAYDANAIITSTVTANGQNITLPSGETYTMSNRYALIANNSGTITGDNVSITTNHGSNTSVGVLSASGGGQIILTNSTISHLNPNNLSYSADNTIAIRADGAGTLIDISDSTLESFNRLIQVTNGATAKLSNNTITVHRYGLQTIGAGSSLEITGSDITILSTGVSLSSRNGSLLTVSDSDIHANGNYGVALSWDSNISAPNQTSASTGVFDNVTIETQLSNNTGYGLWLIGRSQALMTDSSIIINGNTTSGIFADKSQELSELRNTSIETRGSNVTGVSMKNGSQILLTDGSSIITHGDNTTALSANHNTGTTPTRIFATNADITLGGATSYGALTESSGSEIYLDDVRLTVNGNNSIGLFAREAGATLHANRVNAQINAASSIGMRVQNGVDAQLNNSTFNVTGAGSTGVVFSTINTGDSNSMQITGTHIETQDGYAIRNESGALNLTLNDSTLIGRSNGQHDVAIGIVDITSARRSGPVNIIADNSHITGDIVSLSNNPGATLDITLNNASSLTGRLPFADSLTLNTASQWNVTADSTVTSLINRGSVAFVEPGSSGLFKTVTVNGDYTGGGRLIINTTLDDDMSDTDKLIVNGNTSGTTGLMVNNFGGNGELTTNGIEVITVGGQSDGVFTLQNRAVAGAYEYFLHKDSGNWYLRSEPYVEPPVPPDPGTPDPGTPDPDPSNPGGSGTGQGVYRPEAGGYLSNMSAANRIFHLRLEDREGRAQNSSMWLRQAGSHNKSRDTSSQLHTSADTYVVQGGGEIWHGRTGNSDRFGLGIMAAYGRTVGDTRSQISHYKTRNTLDGYNVGVYGTWYQNADTLNGTYVDSWLQYSWFDAKVKGEQLGRESYSLDGFSASLEAGYRMQLQENRQSNLFITPQMQTIWSGVNTGTHYETNGTRVQSNGANNIQTRLGARLSLDSAYAGETDTKKLFTVYGEANWLYNSKNTSVMMNNVQVSQTGNRHLGEVKLGVEGQLNQQFSVWANVAHQMGDHGYSDTIANLGVKYQF